MVKKWVWIVGAILLVIILSFIYRYPQVLPGVTVILSHPDLENPRGCGADVGCVLSSCDCTCYGLDETPEEKQGIVCAKNCKALADVESCKCKRGVCTAI